MRPGGQPITCFSCRALLAEDAEPVPCDTGGLAACLYLRTHGYSPGESDHPDDLFAWRVYWEMQRVGWDAVKTLRKLDLLDEYDADWLLLRLLRLHDVVHAQKSAAQEQR